MAMFNLSGMRAAQKLAVLAISMLVTGAGFVCAIAAGPVSTAAAGNYATPFCDTPTGPVWLDPAWTGNYRCDGADSVSGYERDYVLLNTYERAGCLNYADVWHNLQTSWVCIPKGTEFGGRIDIRRDGGWYRGVIRNNNTSYGGHFKGWITWG